MTIGALTLFSLEYPQQASQKEGLGFPVARMVVLMSFATAMLSGMAIGPYSGKETGELALMRELLDQLNPDDILLTDRYYCSYFMIALILERNIDFVARLHHARKQDAYRTKRLGKNDFLIEWQRPQRPEWMDKETYGRVPKSLTLRQVEVKVEEPGFRVESLVVVTTLIDEQLVAVIVGKRPNRVEPRAVKRRPKPIRYLTMKRDDARTLLLRGIDPYKKRK